MSRYYDLAIFDMDGTLTKCQSSWSHVHSTFEVDNKPNIEAFIKGEIDEHEFIRRDIALWKNKDPNVRLIDVSRVLRDMPLIDGIQETIVCLKYNRIKSVICSGGIMFAAKMIAEEYGFDDYIADELETDENGILTGEGIVYVDLMDKGKNAVDFIKKYNTTPERTVSIGDSFTDIKMFKATGTSIAFNPKDKSVAEAADHVIESDNIADILDIILKNESPEF